MIIDASEGDFLELQGKALRVSLELGKEEI
jgi:hypothetical protein